MYIIYTHIVYIIYTYTVYNIYIYIYIYIYMEKLNRVRQRHFIYIKD